MKEQSNFRYDIGLLRALSVLVVVFYHFKVPFFSGGFIGVDVFFVISGFLMTKIILTGFDNQNFNLKIFYINRVKRIIPALLVLLLFVLLISNILFFANDVKINSIYIFLSNFFVSNVYYWLYSGYFDPASHENILLHTWSLSVEWQFYILYPIILLLFRKKYLKKRNLIAKVLILITVFSFLAAAFLTKEFNSFTFYMFPTRAWEMTFGGLAFLYSNSIKDFISGNWKKIIVLFSLVTILLCSMLINESFLWPSYFTIIPVISTFLILTLSDYNNKFFKNKLIQFFGKISYSLYLWHWPIFIIFKYFGIINFVTTVMMLIISMVMAILSYYFVEQNEKFLNYKRVLLFSIIISFLSCLFFFFPINSFSKIVSVYNNSTYEIVNYFDLHKKEMKDQYNPCGCYIDGGTSIKSYKKEECLKISTTKRNILLIGDSHSAQYSKSFRENLKDENIIEVSAGFTFPFIDAIGKDDSKRLMNFLYSDFLPEQYKNIDIVVFSVHWPMYQYNLIDYSKEELKIKMLQLIKYYEDKRIKFIVLGQTESYLLPFPRIIAITKANEKANYDRYINKETSDLNNYLKSFKPKKNYIDIYNLKGIKKFDSKNKIPYMFDDSHLTKFGADQIVDYLIKSNFLDKKNK